jgi:hypothetical protein
LIMPFLRKLEIKKPVQENEQVFEKIFKG